MAENSHISWTNHTFNPWIGCTKVSPACDGCYAAELMGTEGGRFKRVTWGEPGKGEGTRDRTKDWSKPRKWNREAAAAPGQTFVFCASLADVFDNAVPPEWRVDLFQLIRETPNLTWLLLTKRPGMIMKLFVGTLSGINDPAVPLGKSRWPANAAIGCTVVNQEEADRDIPKLLEAKAALAPAFAFLSMEPLLGPVDLRHLRPSGLPNRWFDGLAGPAAVDWVITGGETDQGAHLARPHNPRWFMSLRDQCAAAGVAYHHKQNGEWARWEPKYPADDVAYVSETDGSRWTEPWIGREPMVKIGKARDPQTLDGVFHRARPVVA